MSTELPYDHPLHWRAGEVVRWLQWQRGREYWTDDERHTAHYFLQVTEIAALHDADGVSAAVEKHPDPAMLARVAVWVVARVLYEHPDGASLAMAWLTPQPGLDASAKQLELYKARAEIVQFSTALIQLMTIPVEQITECGHPYCYVTDSDTPLPLHILAATFMLGELYESNPRLIADMRSKIEG